MAINDNDDETTSPPDTDSSSSDDSSPGLPAGPIVTNPAVAASLQQIMAQRQAANQAQLADAQQQVQRNQATSGLFGALGQVGASIAGAPQQGNMQGIVNAIGANDKAPLAVAQANVAQGNKLFGLGQTLDAKQQMLMKSLQEKLDIANQKADSSAGAVQSKADKAEEKLIASQLDSSGPRAGNFGQAGKMVMSADRVNAILKQFPDGNIPKAQTTELATAAAAMIGGGSVQSQHQLDAIVPSSIAGDVNAMVGWLTNEPRGLQQQAFMRALGDSANRERDVAQGQMDAMKAQRLSGHYDFATRNPDTWTRLLKGAQMDPANYDPKSGLYTVPSKDQGAQQGPAAPAQPGQNTVSRKTSDGKTAIFDANTKQFLRYQ